MLVRLVFGAVVAAVLLAGCAENPAPAEDPTGDTAAAAEWFQPCPTVSPSAAAAGTPAAGDGGAAASPMPAVSLPCIRHGEDVDLGTPLGVPTVVNVWASWCEPCREELPAFQRYADRAGGEVQVLGVVSGDTRRAALALARELDVRFPTLYDKGAVLIRSLGRTALPVTLFLDARGRLVHVYNGQPLTGTSLATLVERHLGVAV